ncbi:hypothetical protein DL766_003675 [Monosporascus sp. MC13-8B]|uniref:Protein kinase domain-containing protein n=1 Tax=Monosporascus cannonballus TaxID=155416 RepID=A0ABY0H3C4_9PEZI|nr:hypothetical protein DL762_005990 [Monosporascus cannonballus]RYO93648.1 hypothetical protein DL763_004323 [Monosporascus cannonballus]RYP33082.1 hypothetical protein DL766_003675 [Monosporascus sp. MC13-8B]
MASPQQVAVVKRRPLCKAVRGDGLPQELRVPPDDCYTFGPQGETAQNWDYLLPACASHDADGTFQLKPPPDDQGETRISSAVTYDSWLLDGRGRHIHDEQDVPWSAMGMQVGYVTFVAVLTSDARNRSRRFHGILSKIFMQRLVAECSDILGLSGGFTGMPLELAGEIGTYLVVKEQAVRLGTGGHADVFKGFNAKSGKVFACKFMRPCSSSSWDREVARLERQNLSLLKHVSCSGVSSRQAKDGSGESKLIKKQEHIVSFHDFCNDEDVIVMERIHHGSSHLLYGGYGWPAGSIPKLAEQMCSALDCMHSELNMAHKDIKANNILIKRKNPLWAVLTDFGLSSTSPDPHNWGHPIYRAPETFTTLDAHCPADIWALGVTVLELSLSSFSGSLKFDGGVGKEPRAVMAYFEASAANLSPICRIFLKGMLRPDPKKRWSAAGCLQYLENALRPRDNKRGPTRVASKRTTTTRRSQRGRG